MSAEDGEDSTIVLRSPAKINVGLRLIGRRSNGYHELQSLFVPCSLYDEVRLSSAKKTTITYETENHTPLHIEGDTVTRSLGALSEVKGLILPELEISITKRIPMGSGLGGGSSNAGTVLKFLYERFASANGDTGGGPILNHIALKVGADVPFFLGHGPALVEGIGEKLRKVSVEPFALVIAKPPFSVETRAAFGWFDKETKLTQPTPNATSFAVTFGPSGFVQESGVLTLGQVVELMTNDLENAVKSRHPEIDVLKKALRQWGALGSQMSGTGSSVYGIFRTLSEATSARDQLQQNFSSNYAFFTCETIGL